MLGGSPYNVAIGLGRLGAGTAFLSRISTDGNGEALAAGLRDNGVDIALRRPGAPPDDARLRHAGNRARPDRAIPSTSTERPMTAPGRFPTNGRRRRSICTSARSRRSSGTAKRSSQAMKDARRARDRQLRSEHPPVRHAGSRCGRRAGRAAGVARPCREGERGGPRVALSRAARSRTSLAAWAASGPRFCVATLGERGALALLGKERIATSRASVDVVDTVGAGDSFMSALLVAMERDGALGAGSAAPARGRARTLAPLRRLRLRDHLHPQGIGSADARRGRARAQLECHIAGRGHWTIWPTDGATIAGAGVGSRMRPRKPECGPRHGLD